MAISQEQKVDFLLKKIGFTASKTGNATDATGLSGTLTPKAGFAEAIPSPLIIANTALWNESASIPATPPGSDTTQVKVYAPAGALRMTVDSTVANNRAFIAYTTYNNTSSPRLTNWIDTQFGPDYIIQVFVNDATSSSNKLNAGGSGQNDGWFFDYSAGVLNFNDTNVPSSVTSTNVYIVGYRYVGQTGAPTSGISTFSYLDLTVERNLDVGIQGGISTFRNNIDLNANLDVSGTALLRGNSTFVSKVTTQDDVDIEMQNTFAYFDDSSNSFEMGLNSGQSGRGVIVGFGSENQSSSFSLFYSGYDSYVRNAGTYQPESELRLISGGSAVRIGKGSTAGAVVSIANTDLSIVNSTSAMFDTGADLFYNNAIKLSTASSGVNIVGTTTTGQLAVTGVSTFTGNIDANGDLDVDGHTNLDNVNVSGVTTIAQDLDVDGHTFLDNISVAGVSTFTGDATFAGNVSIGGTLTYEDVTNVDSVGLLTARSGIRVTGGVIEALAGENKIPSLYNAMGNLPSAGSYHGMFAHVHATGRGYFAHAGNWLELVNKEINGVVGTGTETYVIGNLVSTSSTTTSLNVVGVATFGGNVDVNGNIFDADGHTNLDNVSIAGVTTIAQDLDVDGHTNLDNVNVVGVATFTGSKFDILSTGETLVKRTGNNINSNVLVVSGSENGQPLISLRHNNTGIGEISKNTNTGIRFKSNTLSLASITGTESYLEAVKDGAVELYYDNVQRLRTASSGIEVIGVTTTTGLAVTGVSTFTGNIDANGDLDVDGHTNLDNVSVAGVSTFSDRVTISGGKDLFMFDNGVIRLGNDSNTADFQMWHDGGHTRLNNATGSLYINNSSTNGSIRLNPKNGESGLIVRYDGAVESFYANTLRFSTSGVGATVYGNLDVTADIDVDGHTNLDNVSISGVTTTAGNVDINADLDVDGHTNLDNVNIAGVTTANGHVLPSVDSTYDLGSSSKQWRNLYADNIVSAPGFGFLGEDLTVRNFKATGISTFTGNARFNSTIAVHDGTTGSNGQYLKSIGTGVTWASFPTFRTRQTFTASAGQTTFSFTYNANFIDVYVNGIKLTDSEFTATNGTSVVLAVGCFVGDIVELVGFNTVSTGAGGGGGSLNNIVEDTTPQLGGNLDMFNKSITGTGNVNITGIITATNFVGDGSGLTNVVGSGSGVIVKNSGSTVGTAGTINFGDNLSVSAISAGIVTITGSAGVDTSQFNVNNLDVSGITTVSGMTTFSDTVHFAYNPGTTTDKFWFWGNGTDRYAVFRRENINSPAFNLSNNTRLTFGTLQQSEIVSENSQATFIRQYTTSSNNPLKIESDFSNFVGSPTSSHSSRKIADFEFLEGCSLYYTGTKRLQTSGIGITVTGSIVASGDLDVDGHTNLDNVSIAGVVTATTFKGALEATSASFSSNIDANGDLDVDGHTNLDNVSVAGVITATSFVGDGSSLTGISGGVTSDGSQNTVGGSNAGDSIVSGGTENTVFGYNAGTAISTGDNNTFFGSRAGRSISTGLQNTGVGYNVMGNTSGTGNAALGQSAGNGILGGSYNVALGWNALSATNNNGTNNIVIGKQADISASNVSNEITLGNGDITHFRIPGIGVSFSEGGAVVSGVVTATSFVGDGSALTGVTASGSGVVVQHDGSNIGTAGTINFSTNLDVSAISAGIVTITASGGGFSPDAQGNLVAGTNAGDSFSGTDANNNVLLGLDAGTAITTADGCVFIGANAGEVNTTRSDLVSIGANSGTKVDNAYGFTAVGDQAGKNHQTGSQSTYIGKSAGRSFTGSAANNTIIGSECHYNASSGSNNVSVGKQAMALASDASACTAVGTNSLQKSSQGGSGGDNNTALGYEAGKQLVTGSNCTILGFNAQASSTSVSNEITLGDANVTKFRIPGIGVTFKDNGGTPTQGHVLTVDANGEASFAAASGGSKGQKGQKGEVGASGSAGSDGAKGQKGQKGEVGAGGSAGAKGQKGEVGAGGSAGAKGQKGEVGNTGSAGNDGSDGAKGQKGEVGSEVQVQYTVTANGASAYRFAGNGVVSTTDNPDLYLIRGQKYRFVNNSGGSHPFQIRVASGGAAYSTGVTNNGAASGNIDFAPTFDSPSKLVYQCTSHGGMVGNIYIRGAAGQNTNVGLTTFSNDVNLNSGDLTVSHSGLAVNIFESTDNHSRLRIKSSDASLAQLEFADQSDADAGEIRYDHGNDRMTFHVGNNVEKMRLSSSGHLSIISGNLEFANGSGIDFSNVPQAGSGSPTTDGNKLDDYEEGSFTPTLKNFNGTYSIQTGRYTKVGNIVHYNVFVKINSAGDTGTPTGINLPFDNASGMTVVGHLVGNEGWDTNLSESNITTWMPNGSNEARFYKNSGLNLNGIRINDIGNSGEIAIAGSYRV